VKLAAIATMYGRHDKTLPLLEQIFESSRVPDELWIMCEGIDDADVAINSLKILGKESNGVVVLPTDLTALGQYAIIPYSHKINWVLNRTGADAIVYVDNGSMPSREKYQVMIEALENNPSWGAVYCSQTRSGIDSRTEWADRVVDNAYAVLNYTQVMHRKTDDRWTTNMAHANPDVADAMFWQSLHKSIGKFYPVDGERVHDWHHIPSHAAQGI